jgi:transposase
MAKIYIVDLTQVERETLIELTCRGKPGARKVKRANILLLADQGKKDEEIVTLLHTSRNTVIRTRRKFVDGGLTFALNERSRAGRLPKVDDKVETILTTLAQSQPPDGRKRWTLQLLADRLVTLTHLDSLSYETVRLVLKKNDLKPWIRQKWCIPTVIGAEFVWLMEDILDLYAEPYRPDYPVICFDEVPYQLVSETRKSLPLQPGKPTRYDYEYRREGTCNMFMFLEPLAGWRHVKVTDRRTKQDFAVCMNELVKLHCPEARKVRVVLDNLNTHTPASLYERYSPEKARELVRKLEFHHTPKHSSWLNMAEVEISVLNGQCLDRRVGSRGLLESEIAAWENERNARKATIDWRFTIPNARDKLKRLYPLYDDSC